MEENVGSMEIIKYKSKGVNLGELVQSTKVKFSVLKPVEDNYEQITPFVLCRDFICDVYYSSLVKKDISIYGMEFKGSEVSPSWDSVYLQLYFPSEKMKKQLYENISILHSIEDKSGVVRSEILDLSPKQSVVIGNKEWLNSALSLSLYTLLIRLFCNKFENEDWITQIIESKSTDSKYLADFPRATLDAILNDLSILKMENWCGLEFDDIHAVHSNSGIIAVCSKSSESSTAFVKMNKHWQHIQKLGLKTFIK